MGAGLVLINIRGICQRYLPPAELEVEFVLGTEGEIAEDDDVVNMLDSTVAE